MYRITTAVQKLKKLKKRIHGIQGGASASKTISITQILIDKAQRDTVPCLASITSESVPHLKKGAMRDFKNIMLQHMYWDDNRWNATDSIYTFETGSQIEFFSLDQSHKVRGPRRKRLFINEANNIPYETFDQLEVRTEEEIWLDWNPVSEFWWHIGEEGQYDAVCNREDADSLILTYKDNEGLPESIVRSMEMRRDNPMFKSWWRVYGEGQIGEVEGRIYTGWEIINEVPQEARLEVAGLDFGYTNDPTAIVEVYKWNDALILNQRTYKKKLLNSAIAKEMEGSEEIIIADSAEPKSIDELTTYGLTVLPANKGQGSVLQGIQSVQNRKIYVTKQSTDLLKEYRGYLWQTDANGKPINKPIPYNDHCMDALRYAISYLYPLPDDIEVETKPWKHKIPNTYVPVHEPEDNYVQFDDVKEFY